MKSTYKYQIWMRSLFLILGVLISILLYQRAQNQTPSFERVNVLVYEIKENISPMEKKIEYQVLILDGQTPKELQNVRKRFLYRVGETISVVKSKDTFYEDEQGLKANSSSAYVYFLSLLVNLILIFFLLLAIVNDQRLQDDATEWK